MSAKRRKFSRIFIPNRGEIACRIIGACNSLGITPILGYSLADAASRARTLAPESLCLGGADARESYLNIKSVLARAAECQADAIHPGYGFLAENSAFSRAVEKAGITFIGPSSTAMKKLGDKIESKKIAKRCGVPILEGITVPEFGTRLPKALASFLAKASFPLLIKASAGGGGRGMRVVTHASEAAEQCAAAAREAKSIFGDGSIFIEPYITGARHVEVQIISDRRGSVRALGTRDCSLQRRHQKVIEEAPAIFPALENMLCRDAEKLCAAAQYESLATVEFLVADARYYFLEVNTRLQVEHPVTEESLGIDLVAAQIQAAEGAALSDILSQTSRLPQHSIEARICAEYPERDFRAAAGQLQTLQFSDSKSTAHTLRIETGYCAGDRVGHHYDSLLAKVIATAPTRADAITALTEALLSTEATPLRTNVGYLLALLKDPSFIANSHTLSTANQVLTTYTQEFNRYKHAALAAAALHRAAPHETQRKAWQRLGAWAIRAAIPVRIELRAYEEYYHIEITADLTALKLSGGTAENTHEMRLNTWRIDENGAFSFALDGIEFRGRVISAGAFGSTILIGGERFSIAYAAAPAKRRQSSAGGRMSGEVYAHLPGKIVAIKTANGKTATQGETLLVLESMKMEHAIVAPVTGTVSQLAGRSGAMVQGGELLLRIDPDGAKKRKR